MKYVQNKQSKDIKNIDGLVGPAGTKLPDSKTIELRPEAASGQFGSGRTILEGLKNKSSDQAVFT